ncbi:MAG: hypothetical protein ACE5F9_11785 [Phycisphaerae bacterium]
MTDSSPPHAGLVDEDLAAINAELAVLMQRDPCALVVGSETSLADPLVICGILGGKDVGKSTLINALASARVSADDEEVGAGTTRPMAYVHRDVVSLYHRRFAGAEGLAGKLDVTEHNADVVRNVVLVDLPDFDSDLPHHLEIVSAVAPLLDRIVWVVTPRKIADRNWVELFPKVIKDRRNVYCVLNKTDEMLGDEAYKNAAADTFWQEQHDWVRDIIASVGCPQGESHRFLISAISPAADAFVPLIAERWGDPAWSRNAADRPLVEEIGRRQANDLVRLRAAVLSSIDAGEAEALKRANRRSEIQRNAVALCEHFDIGHAARLLDQACDPDYHQSVLNDVFGAEYHDVLGRHLRAALRRDTDIADEVLSERVARWPLLRCVYWPLRWLVRRIGGRFAGSHEASARIDKNAFDLRGRSLDERVADYAVRVRADRPRAIQWFNLSGCFDDPNFIAERIRTRAATLVTELDQVVIDSLRDSARGPRFWQRWLLWLVLFWFPLGQPLAEGLLQLSNRNMAAGLLSVVRALSATHILTGLAVVLVIDVLVLAVMYARCVRDVRRSRETAGADTDGAGRWTIADRLDDLFVSEAVGAMARPFIETREKLAALRQRLDRLSSKA